MNKLKTGGASTTLARRKKNEGAADGKEKTRITTVSEAVDTTYKVSPLSLRLSVRDKKEVADWVDELQGQTKRKVTAAKILRGLTAMKEEVDQDKLLSLINDMN